MMKHPPIEDQTLTGEQLERVFAEQHFEDILPRCKKYVIEDLYYPSGHPANPDTIHKHGEKFRLDGVTVAVIFHYTHANRTVVRHIRMLRLNSVRYSVLKQPPVIPQKL